MMTAMIIKRVAAPIIIYVFKLLFLSPPLSGGVTGFGGSGAGGVGVGAGVGGFGYGHLPHLYVWSDA